MAKKETAITRARVFPSTYEWIQMRVIRKIGGKTVAEIVEDMRRKTVLFEKAEKEGQK